MVLVNRRPKNSNCVKSIASPLNFCFSPLMFPSPSAHFKTFYLYSTTYTSATIFFLEKILAPGSGDAHEKKEEEDEEMETENKEYGDGERWVVIN